MTDCSVEATIPFFDTNNVSHNLGNDQNTTGNNILDGKQKAKAFMTVLGLCMDTTSSRMASPEKNTTPRVNEPDSQSRSPTRKRSRSTTRVPEAVPNPEVPMRNKEGAHMALMDQYVNRELVHSAAMIVDDLDQGEVIYSKRTEKEYYKRIMRDRMANPAAFFGHGYAGYGNGDTNAQGGGTGPKIVFPAQRRQPAGRKTRELHVSRKDAAAQAEQVEELVPIRLDIEWDKIRLRDTFTWNIHDRIVTPEIFAEKLIEDLNLPLEQCVPLIQQVAASIHEQIHDFHPHVFIDEEPLDPHLPYNAYKDDEMRILIKLNITIGQHTLVDQFEWDINNPMNSPEEFAKQMALDLSLSGEFTTAIAHSIREQAQLFTRSLHATGHAFDGRLIEDQELKSAFLPSPLTSVFRPHQAAKEYSPYLYELNEAELEKTELSLSREERRQKRSVNRRGGPALPDLKDRRRTIRTLVVSSVLPGAAETIEDSRIFKRSATASGKSRRTGLGHRDGNDDSDESDSEDSSPDSPAIPAHLLSGTARTRGMRGAASVAQAAMRANLGRSITPEPSSLHHHETRTSGRKVLGRDNRDDSADVAQTLLLKFRISPDKWRRFLREGASRRQGESLQPHNPSSARRSQSATPGMGTPAPGAMGPPTLTPYQHQPPQPGQQSGAVRSHDHERDLQQQQYQQQSHHSQPPSTLGRVEYKGPHPPSQGHQIVSG